MAIKGVDISENNPVVDFEKLKAMGVQFALIRCGYGSDIVSQDDSRFLENVRKAKAAGIPYGVYLYSYALTVADARSEAAHTLRLLGQIDHPAYGVWFDMEDADDYKARRGMPSNNTLVDICDTFCRELQSAGYYVGIYASLSWFNNQLSDSRLDKYDRWVAQWNSTCDYKKPYGIWQFTDKLMVGGYPFDANWAYKDYPAITGTKKEESELTEAQVKKLVQDECSRLNPTYNTLADVPSYWRTDIEKLMDISAIKGTGNGRLGLTRSEAKSAVVALRLAEQFIERNKN
ncbi:MULTISPECIES: glycoside hydrolase family 25 protein [unclassified Neglectibacter]|uniref:glycoside hydrolase family 25 protein n=1 Tax=unclassified Neglectibacter TaxID=2632164 RepID=UPI00136C152A|nr:MULTISPECIES: glycoside hydrolase family 25 protein [unclassified Neglectibacter]